VADHRWITAPGTEVRLDPTSVVIERKTALTFAHMRMPLSSVRWAGIVRVHRPWLLWSAAIGLGVAVLLTIGARDPWLSRLVADEEAAIERWVWRLVAAPIVAYILTRRVRLVIGGDLDAHDLRTGPAETIGVDLWGGLKHRDVALAFLQKLEWLALRSPRRRPRRTATFPRDVESLRAPELPKELATGADDAMRARALQYGAALGAVVVAMVIGEIVPRRAATEPADQSKPVATKPRPAIPTVTTTPGAPPTPTPTPSPAQTAPAKPVTLTPDSFEASTAFDKQKEKHPAKDAFDGNPATAWCESAPGAGEGEWIEARFSSPRKIREIQLSTGWDYLSQYGDLFVRNSRFAKVTVTFDGSHAVTREPRPDDRSLVIAGLDVTAKTVRIVAKGVHPGKDPDLCISEIRILGEPSPTSAAPASEGSFGGTVASELAAEDADFVDTRDGAGWGDRCFLHYKASRYRNAKAACERGLALGPGPNVAGALYYNLGLVEEKAGSREAARRYYAKSLEVRPGNATVQKALAGVSDAEPKEPNVPPPAPTAKPAPTVIDSPF